MVTVITTVADYMEGMMIIIDHHLVGGEAMIVQVVTVAEVEAYLDPPIQATAAKIVILQAMMNILDLTPILIQDLHHQKIRKRKIRNWIKLKIKQLRRRKKSHHLPKHHHLTVPNGTAVVAQAKKEIADAIVRIVEDDGVLILLYRIVQIRVHLALFQLHRSRIRVRLLAIQTTMMMTTKVITAVTIEEMEKEE